MHEEILLIGSQALSLRVPNILSRVPADWDYVMKKETWARCAVDEGISIDDFTVLQSANGKSYYLHHGAEVEIAAPNSSGELLIDLVSKDPETVVISDAFIPSLGVLFTLKKSHRFLRNSPHFWKTALDYHKMKMIGCTVPDRYKEFFELREKETYNYKHPSLNVTKEQFFDGDQVPYVYDHDSIHRAVALLDKPAYEFFKKDGEEVMPSKKKFMQLPHHIKLYSYVEEAAVLALERSIIPHPGKMQPKQAWGYALSKILSSISSGWWREWGYENIFEILTLYPEDYIQKFERGVLEGTVYDT